MPKLPALTEPKFNVNGTSADIDRRVRGIVAEGLSVYRVKTEMLRDLRPDVIVTQSQCEVCAVSMSDVERAVSEWTGLRPTIISLAPSRMEDVWKDIESVGTALGVGDRGVQVASRLRDRYTAIGERAAKLSQRPSVAFVEWIDPLMTAGNWVPQLIETAGGRNLLGRTAQHSSTIEFEELERSDPDILILSPCGFTIERTTADMKLLERIPGWSRMRAVREGRVYVADGNQYFNRSGPRLVESAEILAEVIHPETFQFGHEGDGWRRPGSGKRRGQRGEER